MKDENQEISIKVENELSQKEAQEVRIRIQTITSLDAVEDWVVQIRKDIKGTTPCRLSNVPSIEVTSFKDTQDKTPTLNQVSVLLNKEVEKKIPETISLKIKQEVQKEVQIEIPHKISTEELKNDTTAESELPTAKNSKEKVTNFGIKTRSVKAQKRILTSKKPMKKAAGLYEPTIGKDNMCKDCGMYFSSQGLGGHRAKSHQGQNKEYKAKLKVRNKNEHKRTILRLAQYMYYKKHANQNLHPKDIPRTNLLKLKREITVNDKLKNDLLEEDYGSFLKAKKIEFKNLS
mmetsp:Transcript_6385/g.7147  ORF Transcript_6385/g.7147 Transcript_6385/m.7147 type:complete len:289 (+) Transcript_6385:603-1469(+)|eukprot:CAMPEP_0205800858 /NCGR_PEP_ID=MMETSP0205-20121125/2656_1 /ASSEMBLY_ACC=CAM_ASM_000278 /TAXON_ID=36767 /ORGANISM="Euplotes focardii, Strain TN1" /LENGTH=288 /DNA_ID=CAMNT_0053064645 /DNA_START=546 /DNA_END=1412 /DNA_ORIENTATION=+